jgi:hypothetical protein
MSRRICRYAPIAFVVCACAQAGSPPGGEPDRFEPRIEATTPDTFAVVPNFDGEVVFRFDETLSERGVREDEMVAVSPETGEVDVDRDGNELKIRIDGGWRRGLVYHVTVLPGLQDRHGNRRTQPYELVFSTGPEILRNAIAGLVRDRLTTRAVANARVVAVNTTDSLAYVTLTDTAGFFALRSLPLGAYRTIAFLDMNRNREVDFSEPRDEKIASLVSAQDTPVVELVVLAPDTTPTRLLRAESRDTTSVRLTFDDFIAPNEPLGNVAIGLWRLPDSTAVRTGNLMLPAEYERIRRALQDTTAQRPPAAAAPTGAPTDTVRLPTQELVLVPPQPLLPGTRYRISIGGVRNIIGLPNGGGTTTFETPARPRAAPRDTTAAPPDSIR